MRAQSIKMRVKVTILSLRTFLPILGHGFIKEHVLGSAFCFINSKGTM